MLGLDMRTMPFADDLRAGLSTPFVGETGAAFLLVMGLAPVVVRTVVEP